MWKEIILFIIFFMEATHSSLVRDFRILLLSVLLEPPKETWLTRGGPKCLLNDCKWKHRKELLCRQNAGAQTLNEPSIRDKGWGHLQQTR